MAMKRTFGSVGEKTEGLYKRVTWPQLALQGIATGDGRMLADGGGDVRDLPRTAYSQFAQDFGHMGSIATARIDEVTFDEDGLISGEGWLADTDEGRLQAKLLAAKILFHNSIDLTEGRVHYEWDEEAEDIKIIFDEWTIGGTTFVGKPAFRDAHGELTAAFEAGDYAKVIDLLGIDDDEITAALESDEPLVWDTTPTTITFPEIDNEVTASDTAVRLAWADFNMPETPSLQKIVVTADGAVFGHLASWDGRHGSRGIRPPYPRDNYAGFNQAGPLTERGQVETGPIFFLGGHPDHPLGERTAEQAYGGIENAWADVRVTAGRLGPWISGRVRPGQSSEAIHAARCSRISGHWKGDDLVAIVSVNVPAYNIPGSGLSFDHDGEVFADGKVLELTASLFVPGEEPLKEAPKALLHFEINDATRAEIEELVREAFEKHKSTEPITTSNASTINLTLRTEDVTTGDGVTRLDDLAAEIAALETELEIDELVDELS